MFYIHWYSRHRPTTVLCFLIIYVAAAAKMQTVDYASGSNLVKYRCYGDTFPRYGWCPENYVIQINDAYYGFDAANCIQTPTPTTCCKTSPGCRKYEVSDKDSAYYAAIQNCNGQIGCAVVANRADHVNLSCNQSATTNYIAVQYSCSPPNALPSTNPTREISVVNVDNKSGMIAGVVVGILALLAVVAAITVIVICLRRKRIQKTNTTTSDHTAPITVSCEYEVTSPGSVVETCTNTACKANSASGQQLNRPHSAAASTNVYEEIHGFDSSINDIKHTRNNSDPNHAIMEHLPSDNGSSEAMLSLDTALTGLHQIPGDLGKHVGRSKATSQRLTEAMYSEVDEVNNAEEENMKVVPCAVRSGTDELDEITLVDNVVYE